MKIWEIGNLSTRLVIALFIVLGLAALALSHHTLSIFEGEIQKRAELTYSELARTQNERIRHRVSTARSMTLGFALDSSIQRYFLEPGTVSRSEVIQLIDSFLSRQPGFKRVAILDPTFETRMGRARVEGTEGHIIENWESAITGALQAYRAMSRMPVYTDAIQADDGERYIRFSIPVMASYGNVAGTLVFDFSLRQLTNELDTGRNKHRFAIVDDEGNLLYASQQSANQPTINWDQLIKHYGEAILLRRQGALVEELTGRRYFILHHRMTVGNNARQQLTLVRAVPEALLLEPARGVRTTLTVINAGIFAAVFLFLAFVFRRFTKPLEHLTSKVGAYSPGQPMELRESGLRRADEVGELYRAFQCQSEALNAAFRELADRVNELHAKNEALAKARDEAGAAAQAKSNFLAVMSHEIRTPLNSIVGFAQLLETENEPEEQREFCLIIRRSSTRLLELINNILDYTRIQSGKVSPRLTTFDLQLELHSTLESFQLEASSKELALKADLKATQDYHATTDQIRLRQIVSNLVNNAIKFTNEGEVQVRAILEAPHDSRGKAALMLTVTDTGIGMEPKACKNIFEPFEQIDSSTSRPYEGSGLGLAIVSRIIEILGGSIWVNSQPGRGSTFFVRLPLHELKYQPSAQSDSKVPDKKRIVSLPPGLRVLQVEDDPKNRLLMESILHAGRVAAVESVGDSRGMTEKLQQQRFDLVLMDLHLGEENGLDLIPAIRSARLAGCNDPEIPIFVVSAYSETSIQEQAQQAGANRFILKPVQLDSFSHEVESCFPERGKR
jgi:signal transduction histidine kinase/ActR/RegA family two-component response regulator